MPTMPYVDPAPRERRTQPRAGARRVRHALPVVASSAPFRRETGARGVSSVLAALLAAAAPLGCGPAASAGPDLILTGGRVYLDGTPEHVVSALAIEGERVLAVGSDVQIRALAGEDTQEMDLLGMPVLPGMYDAWFDLVAAGRGNGEIDLSRAATPREVQAAVRAAAASSERSWLLGGGWDESVWPRPELPNAATLDAAGVDRPVLLWHQSMEFAWANSPAVRALAAAGADAFFWRDSTGTPTGLVDVGLAGVLARLTDTRPVAKPREVLLAGLQTAAEAGITALSAAPLPTASLEALERLRDEGLVQLRIETRLPAGAAGSWRAGARAHDDPLRPRAVGVRLDLPLGPAARARPDGPAGRPPERWSAAGFARLCREVATAGLRLDAHAHGEAAVALALRCPAIAAGSGWLVGVDVAPADLQLLAHARVAAVPTRLAHDAYFLQRLLPAGAQARLHAYATLAGLGVLRAFASLAPAYAAAPMLAVRTAWRRRTPDDYPLDGVTPTETLGVRDALRVALAPGVLGRSAALEPGQPADLVVWSEDPYAGEQALRRARALLTMVGGRVVFSRPLVRPDAGDGTHAGERTRAPAS